MVGVPRRDKPIMASLMKFEFGMLHVLRCVDLGVDLCVDLCVDLL